MSGRKNNMYETVTTNIMVENVLESLNFYQDILDFEPILTVPGEGEKLQFAILKKDSITIMLQSKKSLVEEYPTLNTEKILPSFTLFITVKELEQLYKQLKEKVSIAAHLHQTFYGKLEFAIFGNAHNILTFSE